MFPPERVPAPFTGWQWLYRGSFGIDYAGHHYDIEVDYFDFNERIWLYVDGVRTDMKKTQGTWELDEGAQLEVKLQSYGMRRARLITPEGGELQMQPAPGSGEHWRATMHQRYPRISQAVAKLSLTILVISLLLAIPGWVKALLAVFGVQWSIWSPPPAVTVAMTVLAILAGVERTLRLQTDSFS